MSLHVLDAGLASLMVDNGRPRTRSLGVPVGGAADRTSLALGNALLGNPPDTPALEIALKGPRLRTDADVGCVLFGAPFDAHRDGYPVPVGQTFTLRANEELRIGGGRLGARLYLCVCGGFQGPVMLDSRSGFEPVCQGDILPCQPSEIRSRCCPELCRVFPYLSALNEPSIWHDFAPHKWVAAVVPGQQGCWFHEPELLIQTFSVTPTSNRMGLRLAGKSLTIPDREIVSEPVCPGTIQVTPDGQCIILGVDGQTIGGYPKIAQVIQADLDLLGQLRPGDMISFRKVSLEEAIQLDRQAQAKLREWVMRLRLSLDAFPAERKFASS